MTMLKIHKDSGGILYDDEKRVYLIYSEENKHWLFPKGHIEKGESEIEAAKREVREETGYQDFVVLPQANFKIAYSYLKDGFLQNKEIIFFVMKLQSKEKALADHKGKWVSLEIARTLLNLPEQIEVLNYLTKYFQNH